MGAERRHGAERAHRSGRVAQNDLDGVGAGQGWDGPVVQIRDDTSGDCSAMGRWSATTVVNGGSARAAAGMSSTPTTVSPRRHPDFALAWWSRFLIILSTFMFTTFRLFYLQDRVGLAAADAPAAVTTGVLVYTIALVASGWVAGKISDRTGRRKILVAGSALLFAIGTVLLVHVRR